MCHGLNEKSNVEKLVVRDRLRVVLDSILRIEDNRATGRFTLGWFMQFNVEMCHLRAVLVMYMGEAPFGYPAAVTMEAYSAPFENVMPLIERTHALLENPELGLMSWQEMFNKNCVLLHYYASCYTLLLERQVKQCP